MYHNCSFKIIYISKPLKNFSKGMGNFLETVLGIQIVVGFGSQGINISDRRWRFTDFKHSSLYLIDYPLFLITHTHRAYTIRYYFRIKSRVITLITNIIRSKQIELNYISKIIPLFLWLELLLFYCLNLEALMLIDCIQGQPGFSLISSTL